MKLVIEISEEAYKARKRGEISPWITNPILDAVAKGKPLDDVLDEIRAEIEMEKLEDSPNFFIRAYNDAVDRILRVIDKYKAESEDKA